MPMARDFNSNGISYVSKYSEWNFIGIKHYSSISYAFIYIRNLLIVSVLGNSLVVQWLGLCASTVGDSGSISGIFDLKLRSHKPHGTAPSHTPPKKY